VEKLNNLVRAAPLKGEDRQQLLPTPFHTSWVQEEVLERDGSTVIHDWKMSLFVQSGILGIMVKLSHPITGRSFTADITESHVLSKCSIDSATIYMEFQQARRSAIMSPILEGVSEIFAKSIQFEEGNVFLLGIEVEKGQGPEILTLPQDHSLTSTAKSSVGTAVYGGPHNRTSIQLDDKNAIWNREPASRERTDTVDMSIGEGSILFLYLVLPFSPPPSLSSSHFLLLLLLSLSRSPPPPHYPPLPPWSPPRSPFSNNNLFPFLFSGRCLTISAEQVPV
jgi:hypothetical protein